MKRFPAKKKQRQRPGKPEHAKQRIISPPLGRKEIIENFTGL